MARILALLFVLSILVTVAAPAFANANLLYSILTGTAVCTRWDDDGICVKWQVLVD